MPFAKKKVQRRLDKWDKRGKVFEKLAELDENVRPAGSFHSGGRHYIAIGDKRFFYIAEYTLDEHDESPNVIDLRRYEGPKGLEL